MKRNEIIDKQISQLEDQKIKMFKEIGQLMDVMKTEYFDNGILMDEKDFNILVTFYYSLTVVCNSLNTLYKIKSDTLESESKE